MTHSLTSLLERLVTLNRLNRIGDGALTFFHPGYWAIASSLPSLFSDLELSFLTSQFSTASNCVV